MSESQSGKEAESQTPREYDLISVAYGLAYIVLPQLLHADADRTIGYFTAMTEHAGPFLYLSACHLLKFEPVRDDALMFRTHVVDFSDPLRGYIVEYPVPPPFDFRVRKRPLGPFFSIIVTGDSQA